ncbi:hypothetical protein M378DRAFT_181699 [Amanita muscaria Koide BX008]|uniref:Uncharacterized protein n=1 Tax=Amanita muscaria (strain Koide BX008) TaxID=946122 RepID=A0A0C2WM04_AMAMK|nr:hypothetical protein M378DRAFT_181699 [Amanita muscaria Koide BX008]
MPQPEVVATQPATVTQEPIPVVEPSPPAVAAQPATVTQEPIPVVESSPPAVEQPREEVIADPPGYQTVDNFGGLAKSAPIPIPQRSPQPAEPGAFFGQFRESPQDAESVPASVPASIPEPAPATIPVFMPVPILPSQGGQVPLVPTAPSTPPPPQTRGGYESEQTGWAGPSRQITETPMTMPTTRDDVPPSITSENSSIHEQPLKNPFEDPVVPRIAPLPSQGNGYGYLRQSSPSPSPPPPAHTSATTVAAAAVAAAAALAVPAALIMQGNSKSA